MKKLTFVILLLVLTACSQSAPTGEKLKSEAIIILIENGGTVAEHEQDEALNTALHVFQQLTKLDRRKATKDAQIHIILSALPNRITWSGTPGQLLAQAEAVKKLITFKPSFSDLVMAFDQIEMTIKLTQPDDVKLYWIGPTIHVPFQKASGEFSVNVPQEVPDSWALSSLVDQLSVLKIMRVHPDQDQILHTYLASIGVLERARNGSLDFALLGDAQTKSKLKDLL